MGRRRGDAGIFEFILVIFLIGWGVNFFHEHKKIIVSLLFLAVCTIIIICPLYYFFKFINKRKRNKLFDFYLKKDIECFFSKIEQHLPTLSRKRRLFTIVDDYGYTSYDKWDKEKSKFLSLINYSSITNKYYHGLSRIALADLIDRRLDDYEATNQAVDFLYEEKMTYAEYERFCADILIKCGWNASLTKSVGDQGVDILANKQGFTLAIQCKKYSNPVGNKAVQEVSSGKRYYHADACAVVTNNTYTPSARSLAIAESVLLLHHDDLHILDEKIEELAVD